MANSPTTVLSNHTATAKHSVILGGRPSDRSVGLPTWGGRDPADATQCSLLGVLHQVVYKVHLAEYGRLSYSTGTWTVSQTRYTYAVPDKDVAPAGAPWDELERLGRLVADAWKAEKSGVQLLLEERR